MTKTKTKTPCLDCEDRNSTCHATCERYLTWKQNFAKRDERRNEQVLMARYMFETMNRNLKRHK